MGLRRRGRNRTRTDIIADILLTALRGEKKTHIMYRANLSHKVTGDYLAYLTRMGLIEAKKESERGATYRTTRKGARFLSSFRAMRSLLDEKPVAARPFSLLSRRQPASARWDS